MGLVRGSVIIVVINQHVYFCVLLAERYGTGPIKLDTFPSYLFARREKRVDFGFWEEFLEKTIIRILWGRSAWSLEFLCYSVCHFSCDTVMIIVNKPGAQRSMSMALSLSRQLCQETLGLRDSKVHSKWFLSAGLCC